MLADGETWRLTLGDCVDGMAALPERYADHVIADPEYAEHVHARFGTEERKDSSDARGVIGFSHLTVESAQAYANQYVRIAKRWIILFCDEESPGMWRYVIESAGGHFVRTGTWVKTNAMPQMSGDRPTQGTEAIVIAHAPGWSGRMRWNGGGKPATYHFPVVQGVERIHDAQKPKGLLSALVRDFTDLEEIVVDSHAGSCTTGVSCLELGRRFIGFEKDPVHYASGGERMKTVERQPQLFRPMMKQLSLI